jgi:hypothetical protein
LLGQGAGFQANSSIYIYENVDGMANLFQRQEGIALYHQQLLDLMDTVFEPETFGRYVDQAIGSWSISPNIVQQLKDNAAARRDYVRSILPTQLSVSTALPQVGPSHGPDRRCR